MTFTVTERSPNNTVAGGAAVSAARVTEAAPDANRNSLRFMVPSVHKHSGSSLSTLDSSLSTLDSTPGSN